MAGRAPDCAGKASATLAFDRAVREGNWSLQTGMPMHRLSGQTLGILGHGKIGAAVAARARALGMQVIAHDPSMRTGHLVDGVQAAEAVAAILQGRPAPAVVNQAELVRSLSDSCPVRPRPRAQLASRARTTSILRPSCSSSCCEGRRWSHEP